MLHKGVAVEPTESRLQAFNEPWATKLFCGIGYQGVGGYHPPVNFVIVL